jgi:hypothetical protein
MHAPQFQRRNRTQRSPLPQTSGQPSSCRSSAAAVSAGQRYVGSDACLAIRRPIYSPGRVSGARADSPPHTRASVAGIDGLGRFRPRRPAAEQGVGAHRGACGVHRRPPGRPDHGPRGLAIHLGPTVKGGAPIGCKTHGRDVASMARFCRGRAKRLALTPPSIRVFGLAPYSAHSPMA